MPSVLAGSSAGLIHVKVKSGLGWHDISTASLHDGFGPRHTACPTADRFTEAFTAEQFVYARII